MAVLANAKRGTIKNKRRKNILAQTNELGELCVRGSSLAFGYYNDWEKTKAAFVQNPLNNSYPDIIYKTGDLVFKNDNNDIKIDVIYCKNNLKVILT